MEKFKKISNIDILPSNQDKNFILVTYQNKKKEKELHVFLRNISALLIGGINSIPCKIFQNFSFHN